jgi:molecular chaperone HtpG
MVSMLEQKFEKARFTRVDGDVIDNLIVKEDAKKSELDQEKQSALTTTFRSQLPKVEKVEFNVTTQAMGENAMPLMITQSEYMRRMKEMANIQAGMSFYGEMPDMFNIVLNTDHKLVKEILKSEEESCTVAIAPVNVSIVETQKERDALKKQHEGKKEEEIPTAEKDTLKDLDKKIEELNSKKRGIITEFANGNKVVRQLIDLALLQNGMLKGEALNNFVKRSIELI